ncbi:MAG: DUF3048 domain-containing protein [Patescibacteria group bacterium]|jgi:hypothetical protein|nr:DUF3048 domain-containing protein [Patescibacteria group bacterium]
MEGKTQKSIWKYLDIILIIISLILSFFAYKIITTYYAQADQPLEKIVEEQKKVEKETCLDCQQRRIDGVLVKKDLSNLYPLAVVIENHTEARPQAGIADANLVIEAEVEGGITRFLAFYATGEKPDRIGPIRSARPYFVDWARGLSSLYVHVGGSPEALAKIIKENVLNLNEFYNEKYFWRDGVNDAPHNVFTSGENLDKFLDKKGLDEGDFIAWEFKDEEEYDDRGDVTSIYIEFERDMYEVEWKYNKEENDYIRYMAGEEHKDEVGNLVKAKNIAIAYVEAEVLDSELRLRMDNIGEGDSVVCMDGDCNEGVWKKLSSTSRIRFYDNENNEVKFNRGTTWMEIVRPEIEVAY